MSITLLAGILAGIGPALFETRRLQVDPLRGIATSDRVRQRWSHSLVVLEITFTLALLSSPRPWSPGISASRTRSRLHARSIHGGIGFRAHRGFHGATGGDTIARLPGVGSGGAGNGDPAGRHRPASGCQCSSDRQQQHQRRADLHRPGFFATLRVAMRAGRTFTSLDTPETRAIVVSDSFARQMFGASRHWDGRCGWKDRLRRHRRRCGLLHESDRDSRRDSEDLPAALRGHHTDDERSVPDSRCRRLPLRWSSQFAAPCATRSLAST
jgi:hypothetical protein